MENFTITNLQGHTALRNGVKMPYLGLGVFKSSEGNQVIDAVDTALNQGYRHIDTAAVYKNENGVGEAIRNSTIVREDIFVTSKLWNDDMRNGKFRLGFEQTLKKLGFDYLDLYLIHWPVEGRYIDAWRVMEDLLEEGLVRAIGVSNFLKHHLEQLMATTNIVPMVNQLEFHPHLQQPELVDFCHAYGIQYEGWAPLMRGEIFDIPEIVEIGKTHNKNAAQVVLRWHLQKGVIAIPKSVNPSRIKSNVDIFDFELSKSEMIIIDGLDQGRRIGPNPNNFDF